MKSLLCHLCIVLIAIGLISFADIEVYGVDWKFIGDNETFSYFYDTDNITRSSDGLMRVWSKVIYTDQGVMDYVKDYGEEYKDLIYSLKRFEINCVEKNYRPLSMINYSKEKVIDSVNFNKSEWDIFIPESIGESLYKAVCE